MMSKRHIAITVGAVVLVAGVVAGRERPTIELIQERTPQATAQLDDGINLEKLRRGELTPPQNDPFAKKNFGAENRPAAAAPAAPEKPAAPPLPFKYFGKLIEKGKTEVYVLRGDELLAIASGQTVGEYRVDKVSDSAIAFTYLPLKTKQTLELQ